MIIYYYLPVSPEKVLVLNAGSSLLFMIFLTLPIYLTNKPQTNKP